MKHLPRLLLVALFLAATMLNTSRAAAQDEGSLILGAPQTNGYPTVRFQLDAYDSRGKFLDNLKAGDVVIQEDGQTIKPRAIEKIQNGLQTILVLNTGPAMANQSNGTNEYARIQQWLVDWAKNQKTNAGSQPSTSDYSFATPTGLFLIREEDPALLAQALNDYQPDLAKSQPSVNSLAEALDLATDPLSQPFMKRAILYITPPLPDNSKTAIEDLAGRARGIGVRINVWQVKTNGAPADGKVDPLQQLAQMTGGHYEEILPSSPLPQIETVFSPLRHTYQVTYTSIIKSSGTHRLSVQVKRNGQIIDSNERRFSLMVVPPNPIFLSPPASIQRTWTLADNDSPAFLTPNEVRLQILVEFPDQFQRDLKATRLYVNGEMVVENTSTPFDRFTWPIDTLITPSRQMLRVEVEDDLGMTGSSIEIPIDVLIEQPVKASIGDRISTSGMIAVGAVTAAGAVLATALIFTGNRRRVRRKHHPEAKKNYNDPVTQPVSIRQDELQPKKVPASRPSASLASAVWTRPGGQPAPARLVTLDDSEQPITGGAIPLQRQEVTFGTDPRRATQVLTSPTVDGLHARLTRTPEGDYILADQNSVAGTWINYAPVTHNGARLEHGDLIHIGKLMFRFELNDPARIKPVEAKVYDLDKPV